LSGYLIGVRTLAIDTPTASNPKIVITEPNITNSSNASPGGGKYYKLMLMPGTYIAFNNSSANTTANP